MALSYLAAAGVVASTRSIRPADGCFRVAPGVVSIAVGQGVVLAVRVLLGQPLRQCWSPLGTHDVLALGAVEDHEPLASGALTQAVELPRSEAGPALGLPLELRVVPERPALHRVELHVVALVLGQVIHGNLGSDLPVARVLELMLRSSSELHRVEVLGAHAGGASAWEALVERGVGVVVGEAPAAE